MVLKDVTVGRKPTTGVELEEPTLLLATKVKYPRADELMLRLIVPLVPAALILTLVMLICEGGLNANVAPVRLNPVIENAGTEVPARMAFGPTDVITGNGRMVSGDGEVSVFPFTVTVIAPLVAPGGAMTTSVVAVAEITRAWTPLNATRSKEAVRLKRCPWIVTVPSIATCSGVTLKSVSWFRLTVER